MILADMPPEVVALIVAVAAGGAGAFLGSAFAGAWLAVRVSMRRFDRGVDEARLLMLQAEEEEAEDCPCWN